MSSFIDETHLNDVLMVCRTCLATDVKLFYIFDWKLEEVIENFIGTTISQHDDLPHYICVYCWSLLKKSTSFRSRCWDAQNMLRSLHQKGMLTTSYLNSIETNLKLKLTKTTYTNDFHSENEDFIKVEDLEIINEGNNQIENIKDNVVSADGLEIEISVKDEFENKIDVDSNIVNKKVKTPRKSNKIIKSKKKNNTNRIKEDLKDVNAMDLDEIEQELDTVFNNDDDDEGDDEDDYSLIELVKHKRDFTKTKETRVKKEKLSKGGISKKKSKKDIEKSQMLNKYYEKCGFKMFHVIDFDEISKKFKVDISFLTKKEQRQEIEERKLSKNYLESTFKCDICFKGYMFDNSYKTHMLLHDAGRGDFECKICGFYLKTPAQLHEHIRRNHAINFVCQFCKKLSKSLETARSHYNIIHEKKMPTCKHCGKEFTHTSMLSEHIRKEHSSASCPICHYKLVNARSVPAHIKRVHEARQASCASCGLDFQSEPALQRHQDQFPSARCDGTMKSCTLCGANFEKEDSLAKHAVDCGSEPKEMFQCHKCLKTFKWTRVLRRHMIHCISSANKPQNGERKPRGPKKDKTASASWKNMERNHMCDVCGEKFAMPFQLKYHQTTHTGEKPYKCDVCGKAFRMKNSLPVHMNIHLNRRPYKCPFCPKAFTQYGHLDTHKRSQHMKERPYACTFCDKRFSSQGNARSHLNAVHLGIRRDRTRNKHENIMHNM